MSFVGEYKTKTAFAADIYEHLFLCKDNFIPALDKKVDLPEYAKKIVENAVTFEAWSQNKLVGLIAVYFNDTHNKKGYITNVSTLSNYFGSGIASELMKNCVEYAAEKDFAEIELEVHAESYAAIKLYKKFGFVEFDSVANFVKMKLRLN